MSIPTTDKKIIALVFCDVVDSTVLKIDFGDELYSEAFEMVRKRFLSMSEEKESGCDWRKAKEGDALLATFSTPDTAVRFAVALVESLPELDFPRIQGTKLEIQLRVGIHSFAGAFAIGTDGERDLRASGADIAARIQSTAHPSQILLSNEARQHLANEGNSLRKRAGFRIKDHGEYRDKRSGRIINIHEVLTTRRKNFAPPRDADKIVSVKRRREKRRAIIATVIAVVALIAGGILFQHSSAQKTVAEAALKSAGEKDRLRIDAETARAAAEAAQRRAVQNEALREFDLADVLLAGKDGKESEAVAHLARAVRLSPEFWQASDRLLSVLSHRPWQLIVGPPLRHGAGLSALAFSLDERFLVSAGWNGCRLWDLETWSPVRAPWVDTDIPGSPVALAFSPDGQRVAVVHHRAGKASEVSNEFFSIVRVWDVAAGQLRQSFPSQLPPGEQTEASAIHSRLWSDSPFPWKTFVVFSRDGRRMAVSDGVKSLAILESESLRLLRMLKSDSVICSADFSPDGEWVALVDSNGKVAVTPAAREVALGFRRFQDADSDWKRDNLLYAVHYSTRPGLLFASASQLRIVDDLGRMTRWSAEDWSGSAIRTESEYESLPEDTVVATQFLGDGLRILTVEADRLARIRHFPSGQPLGVLTHPVRPMAGCVTSATGNLVAVGADTGEIIVRSIRTTAAHAIALGDRVGYYAPSYSYSGSSFTSMLEDRLLPLEGRMQSPMTARPTTEIAVLSNGEVEWWETESGKAVGERFLHTKGKMWVYWHNSDDEPALFEIKPEKLVGDLLSHTKGMMGVYAVTLDSAGTLCLWNPTKGQRLGVPIEIGCEVRHLAFLKGDRRLLIESAKGEQFLADIRTWRLLGSAPACAGRVNFTGVSENETLALVATDQGIGMVWDLVNGQPIDPPLHNLGQIKRADFLADGEKVLIASVGGHASLHSVRASPRGAGCVVQHWNDALTANSTRVGADFVGGPVDLAALSEDGQVLITGCNTGSSCCVRAWQTGSGTAIGSPIWMDDAVAKLVLAFGGTHLLAELRGGGLRMWDLQRGMPLGEALRDVDRLEAAAFSADNQRLAVCAGGSVTLWDIQTGRRVSEPIPIQFSKDGDQPSGRSRTRIEFRGTDELIVRNWRGSGRSSVPHGFGPVPDWFSSFAETVGGKRLTESGITEPIITAPGEYLHKQSSISGPYADLSRRLVKQSLEGK